MKEAEGIQLSPEPTRPAAIPSRAPSQAAGSDSAGPVRGPASLSASAKGRVGSHRNAR